MRNFDFKRYTPRPKKLLGASLMPGNEKKLKLHLARPKLQRKENNQQLFTEVEVNNGGYLPSREANCHLYQSIRLC